MQEMATLWQWLHSVLAFFFSPEFIASSLYTDLVLPFLDLFFGCFMLYFFLIKFLGYIFELIGSMPKKL